MPTVRLLGPVDVIDDDGVVHTPGSPLRCTLLALLALERCNAVDAEALLERIWDGRPPASGLRALRFHISRLRSEVAIADLIVTVGSAYRLDANTDLVRLTDGLAADTDADTLAALLATRRGDPFLGASACSVLEHERRRLGELTLTITERLYQYSLAEGDTSVIGDLTRLCLEHPVRESLWAVLIRAHYQAGNQADALRAAATLRINLRDELGVDPSREVRQLELQILDHDVPHTPTREVPPSRTQQATHGSLPHPLDSFIGRSDELGVLSGLIAAHRLVSVVGVGGMGKTRLVVEACHRAQSGFDGGVWFVDLALASSDSAVLEEAAAVFGVQAVAGQSIQDRLVEHLASAMTLVVFDNCEHVMRPAAGLIDRLLQACAGLKVVTTSREALLLQGEHVMALGPMSMDDNSGDSGEGCVDAVTLFVDRLTAEGGPVIVDDDERAVVLEICRQLDGMPLAIELAAGRARTLGTTDVLARLGERLRLLAGGWRTGVGRQQTLAATLDWSYVLLHAREQVVFDRLAVFVGWFTLDDAVAVAAADSTLVDLDVLETISALVDKSMCTVDLHATPTRYRYLETMRAYGRDHLNKSGVLTEFRDRHAAHLAASASVIAQMLVGPDELEAARRAERLMPDLRAALGWAVDRHLDDVIDDIAALAVPTSTRGSYEMTGWCYDLRHDLPDRPAVQAGALRHALNSRADLTETRRLGHRLVEMTSDRSWIARQCLALAEFNESHYDLTVDYQTRAYEIGEIVTDERYIHTLNPTLLAIFLTATGHDHGELVEQGFARARAAQWPTGLALAHYAAGLAVLHTDPIVSLEQLNHSLEIGVQVGSRQAEAISQTLINHLQFTVLPPAELAAALTRQLRHVQERRDTVNAMLPLSQVVILFSQTDHPRTAALICGWMDGRSGRDAQSVGDHEAAMTSVRQALGDQWDPLFVQGRSMTGTQILDTACDELQTVDPSRSGRSDVERL